MNCDTCAEKFTRLKDLLWHVSNKWHSHQNSHFFCIPCSLPLRDISIVIEHFHSEEHSIMVLATGIRFEAEDESPDSFSAPFPPLKCCMLCSCRDSNPYQQHMKSSTHGYTASLLRHFISSKMINCFEWQSDIKSHEFIRKMISIKQQQASVVFQDPLPLVCELCNIYFNKPESHKQHLENQSHKRMEQFMIKISNIVQDIEIIGAGSPTVTFSNSLPPLYYCEFCCLTVENTPSYVQHTQSSSHRRIEELSGKLLNKRNGDAVGLSLRIPSSERDSRFNRLNNYCELCTVWFSGAAGYHQHYKEIGHKRIERFVNSLSSFEDKKLIEVYVEAQACMKFSSSSPPNYCRLCNSLYTESEDYNQHLQSDEHRDAERYCVTDKNAMGHNPSEKSSKMLKSIPPMFHHSYYSVEKLQKNKPKMTSEKGNFSGQAHETNCNSLHSPNFDDEIPSLFGLEDSGANNYCPQEQHYCELCDFESYNPLHYDKHLTSEQHKKMRRMLNKKGKEIHFDAQGSETSRNSHPLQHKCELCDVFNYNSQQYEDHLNSGKHKRNQWLLYVFKQKCL